MDLEVTDRRAEPRLPAHALHMEGATLRPGFPVRVVDVSARGAQIQSDRPMRPGRRVHVRLICAGRSLVLSGLILRCRVWALDRDAGVIYRGALRFDDPCSLPPTDPAGRPVCGEEPSDASRPFSGCLP